MHAFATTTELFSYQTSAVQKMLPSRVGALFMEMGTGKTRVAVELAMLRQSKISRVIWFCPVSARTNTVNEICIHTNISRDRICIFDDKTTSRSLVNLRDDVDWYIVGIESISTSDRVALAVNSLMDERTMVVLDESDLAKNPRAKRTVRITKLSSNTRYRLVLTGTPITQGWQDLFSQMFFLSQIILGYHSWYGFRRRHIIYHKHYPGLVVGIRDQEMIARKIEPYVYQVTKNDALDLPKKLWSSVHCLLTDFQEKAYNLAKEKAFEDYTQDPSRLDIFRLFTTLQTIVSGFWTRSEPIDFSRKRRRWTELISQTRTDALSRTIRRIPDQEQIVVYAKYVYDLVLISRALKDLGDDYLVINGHVSPSDRDSILKKWANSSARILVATTSVGGRALSLINANHTIFYNNSFKYAERKQAEDRTHRYGQNRSCTYIDIIATGTIDERIRQSLLNKESYVDKFKLMVEDIKDNRGKLEKLLRGL